MEEMLGSIKENNVDCLTLSADTAHLLYYKAPETISLARNKIRSTSKASRFSQTTAHMATVKTLLESKFGKPWRCGGRFACTRVFMQSQLRCKHTFVMRKQLQIIREVDS